MASVVKATIKNADNISSLYKGVSNVAGKSLDTAGMLRKMDLSAFATTFKKTLPAMKSSSGLIDTGKYAKKFAKAVPGSTDDVLSNLNPAALKKSLTSLKKLDPSAVTNMKSLKKLDNTMDAIKNSKKMDGLKGLTRRSEGVLQNSDKFKSLSRSIPPVNKVDDVGDAVKKSKNAISKVDDVAEKGSKIVKKSSKKIDDAGEAAGKLTKTKKVAKFLTKHNTTLTMGIMVGYYMGTHLMNKNKGNNEEQSGNHDIMTDPGSDLYPVEKYDEMSSMEELENALLDTIQDPQVLILIVIAIVVVTTI